MTIQPCGFLPAEIWHQVELARHHHRLNSIHQELRRVVVLTAAPEENVCNLARLRHRDGWFRCDDSSIHNWGLWHSVYTRGKIAVESRVLSPNLGHDLWYSYRNWYYEWVFTACYRAAKEVTLWPSFYEKTWREQATHPPHEFIIRP